jgi:glycosyltransferase involved in cell wall biosynthesis
VAAFRKAGHEVLVIGPAAYDSADFGGESRLVARLRALLPSALSEAAELAYNLPAWWRLRRAARSFRPDLLYERYNLYHLAGAWLARRHRLLYYLEVNAPIADERARYSGLRLVRLARAIEGWTWRSADRVLAVTGVLADLVADSRAARARISVVPNGIDPGRFGAAEPRAVAPDPVVLGFVGFVRGWHGLDAVIRALASHAGSPAASLVVVGDGPARSELETLAAGLGLGERVTFTGLAGRDAVPALLARFDIALQPKVVAYASPLKVFEYMAAGRAIVAPDQPNIREILVHEATALLFDPDRPEAMWREVERLIHDPALRARLGAAARAEIGRRGYTWAANAERIAVMAGADAGAARRPRPGSPRSPWRRRRRR